MTHVDPLAQPYQIGQSEALRWLTELHEYYSGREQAYYQKLWGENPEWREADEREWDRYRCEAAALKLAINTLNRFAPIHAALKTIIDQHDKDGCIAAVAFDAARDVLSDEQVST